MIFDSWKAYFFFSFLQELVQPNKKKQSDLVDLDELINNIPIVKQNMCTDDNQCLSFIDLFSRIDQTTSTIMETNSSITNYELSQDLRDKQIEILERKYGGNLRCRHAATIIQRAYRQYKLKENFRHLCATVKTNKRLSCTFIQNDPIAKIKPLKPCLKIPKTTDHHLDLPSINFEHFIESNKQDEPLSTHHRKRVCIITDQPVTKNLYEEVDVISDFVDGQRNEYDGILKIPSTGNDWNYYQNLSNSPFECRKAIPSGKILDDNR